MNNIDPSKRSLFRRESKLIINNLMPWVEDAAQLINNCIQCESCITSCPEDIIVKGDGGFPVVDFSLGECTFCGQCAESCE